MYFDNESKCIHDNYFFVRRTVAPTGSNKYDICILIDACLGCDCVKPIKPKRLSWHEKKWIQRWNEASIKAYGEKT